MENTEKPRKYACQFTTDYNDIIGQKFGELEVLEYVGRRQRGKRRVSYYRCKCSCGKEKIIARNQLLSGQTKSCGHLVYALKEEKIGDRFGKLVILSKEIKENSLKRPELYYKCQCDCGNTTVVRARLLRNGQTKSCGCLQKEVLRKMNSTQNGLSTTKIYKSWYHMMQRCTNPKARSYDRYGGAGITVCERWKTFLNFYEDMKDSYYSAVEKYGDESLISIDRIDGTKGYYKENCRWITIAEQNLNLSSNRLVTVYGNTMPLSQAVRLYAAEGVTYSAASERLHRGMDIYDVLFTPNAKSRPSDTIKPFEFLRPDQDWRTAYTEDELKGFTN
jgi:hypothetical protein